MAFFPTDGGLFKQGAFQIDPNMTPDQIKRKREQLAAMMGQYGQAKYVGQGLGHLATGIMQGRQNRQLDRSENKQRDKISEAFGRIFNGGGTATEGAPILGPYTPPDPNSPQGIASDAMVAIGKRSPYADAIASVESAGSGDYSAVGPNTGKGRAYGRYQVMDFNIGPWTEKYLGKRMTPDEFLANPQAQDAVFNGEFGGYVNKYGNPQDAASMWFSGRPMAEAGNSSDGYNTVPQYVDKFTNAMGGEKPTQASGGPDIATLAQIAASPYADPGQKAIAQAMLQQQMQAMDPSSRLDLEYKRAQIDAMKNPARKDDRTSDQKEYATAVQDYILRNEPVPTFTEWTRANRGAGAAKQTVNVGDGGGARMGTIPQGYTVIEDPNSPAGYRMVAIPGGPEDTSALAAAAESNAATASDVVTTAAQRAREAAGKRNFGPAGTSLVAGLPIIGQSTDSGEVVRNVDVLKAQAQAGNLQAMRDASKTGGALGNVTEKELKLLSDKSGALNPDSPTFERDLDDYERTLLRVIHGQEAGDAIFEQTRGTASQPAHGSATMPPDFAQKYGDVAKSNGVTIEQLWEAWPK